MVNLGSTTFKTNILHKALNGKKQLRAGMGRNKFGLKLYQTISFGIEPTKIGLGLFKKLV